MRGLLTALGGLATVVALLTIVGACRPLGSPSLGPFADASGDDADPLDGPVEQHFGLPPHALPAEVISVVDGDTITVAIGQNEETIRLLGIDTPEKPGGPRPAECHGEAATQRAQELLQTGTTVLLARDAEPRDLYGRLLAYVFREHDGLFVNLALVEDGAATTLSLEPNTTFADVFAQARADARRNGRGLWGECGQPDVVLGTTSPG